MVALYDICPGNGSKFLQPRGPHGGDNCGLQQSKLASINDLYVHIKATLTNTNHTRISRTTTKKLQH